MSWYTCSDCDYINLIDKNSYGEAYCSKRRHYYDPSDSACNYFERGGKYIGSNSTCYLTTAVCDILGYKDNCYYLNSLRNIRDSYMAKEVDCYDLLKEYKEIGPKIVENLYNDPDKEQIAQIMLNHYIKPAIETFENNKDDAVDIYIEMTNNLIDKYDINRSQNNNFVRVK